MGDPVGHWDGDTLVVEARIPPNDSPFNGSSRDMKLTEKFKRVNDDLIMYEFTVDDPAFVRPWTAQVPMSPSEGELYGIRAMRATTPWKACWRVLGGKRSNRGIHMRKMLVAFLLTAPTYAHHAFSRRVRLQKSR